MGWLCLPMAVVGYDRERSCPRDLWVRECLDDLSSRSFLVEREDLLDLPFLQSDSDKSDGSLGGPFGSLLFLRERSVRLLVRLDLFEVESSESDSSDSDGV